MSNGIQQNKIIHIKKTKSWNTILVKQLPEVLTTQLKE